MAPMTPGTTRRFARSRCTLPTAQCESPDTPVVTTSAACTLALANFGGTPRLSSTVVAVTPYAIPSAPSIICARNPTIANQRMDSIDSCPSKDDQADVGVRLSRRLLVSTDTDDTDMAAAAIIGLSCQPVQGYRAPAARGMPSTL